MFKVDLDHFIVQEPQILENDNLRVPQKEAYQAVFDHFMIAKRHDHAKIVLPTGTGKTGLMAIIPYGIATGRVLIITPQLIIKDAVLGSLDPEYDKNFWIMTRVFEDRTNLPSVIEYQTEHEINMLQYANIVILNVHKLQTRLKSSLLNKVPHDFFDMIIIDEAHHSEAQTWQEALEYFSSAKVVKVTGTPFRSDGKEIQGTTVYEYKLREAMANGYVKTLERIIHVPEKLLLSIDKDETCMYTIDQIRELGLQDEDWINRSVALSQESNMSIVKQSINLLEDKLSVSQFPHKIIAVASSIWHAEKLKALYEQQGYNAAIVHSKMDKTLRQQELDKIEQHKIQVVINVAMLGEGYDHKFLSVAAIFRPYKGLLPYAQFIGRVLRSINTDESGEVVPEDNIAAVVYHQELGLEKLWEYYKNEMVKKDIISRMSREDHSLNPKDESAPKDKSYGEAREEGSSLEVDSFIESELLKQREQRKAEEEQKVTQMMELLNIPRERAIQLIKQAEQSSDKQRLLRPDLYASRSRKRIDRKIKLEIVPDLLVEYNLDIDGSDLQKIRFLVPNKYGWIQKQFPKNGALLAVYLENRLNEEIGSRRSEWDLDDWSRSEEALDRIVSYLRSTLDHHLRR